MSYYSDDEDYKYSPGTSRSSRRTKELNEMKDAQHRLRLKYDAALAVFLEVLRQCVEWADASLGYAGHSIDCTWFEGAPDIDTPQRCSCGWWDVKIEYQRALAAARELLEEEGK